MEVYYDNSILDVRKEETVLDALHRNGKDVSFSCKKGVCKSCIMQCDAGVIPHEARERLPIKLFPENSFLPCVCHPVTDLKISKLRSKGVVSDSEDDLPEDFPREAFPDNNEEHFKFPEPDAEMWMALKEGELLNEILLDFYTKIYQDPLLSPFFESHTIDRLVQKQYNFTYQVFTGKKVYFGERPRNAHSWMVITDEIFDHREELFGDSLRKFKFPEHLIARWLAYNQTFRKMLVKKNPWPKVRNGIIFPLNGFKYEVCAEGMVCDCCQNEIKKGELFMYHVRLAKTYCKRCISK